MKGIVVDCCTMTAWLGHEHITPTQSRYAERVLTHIAEGAVLYAPSLLHYELSNVLLQLQKSKHLTAAICTSFLSSLHKLPIHWVSDHTINTIRSRIILAAEEGLSAYDAAYLSIAIDQQIPLATFDKKLIQAAQRNQVYFENP